MAISSLRTITVAFSGAVVASNTFAPAAANALSPGQIEIRTLVIGDTTITPPTGGSTPTSVTIVPPTGNLGTIKLKGIAGDTGVFLHKTEPSCIALDSPTATFVLTVAVANVTGLILVWA